jgi:uncharacterized protein YegL
MRSSGRPIPRRVACSGLVRHNFHKWIRRSALLELMMQWLAGRETRVTGVTPLKAMSQDVWSLDPLIKPCVYPRSAGIGSDNPESYETLSNRMRAPSPELRCACVLLLDTSASMAKEDAIGELNKGVKALADGLRRDPVARKRIEIEVISVGGDEATIVTSFCEAAVFEPIELLASGFTPMAGGILLALNEITAQGKFYERLGVNFERPWLIIMTDGVPTDAPAMVDNAIAALRRWQGENNLTVIPAGVGPRADMRFLGRTAIREPVRLRETDLVKFFQWVSTNLPMASLGPGTGSRD